ncbi:MAG: DUF3307 domain-containing protein [Roseovarius sp.]
MVETFTALILAHVLADFVLQTDWLHRNKRNFGVMLLHGAVVLVTAQAALGQVAAPELVALALAHLAIDCLKTYTRSTGLPAFLVDQAAHIVTLAAVAIWAPGLWSGGAYAAHLAPPAQTVLLHAMALTAGLVITLRAGAFAVEHLMNGHVAATPPAPATDPPEPSPSDTGLPGGGKTIGHLERLLIFVLILGGQFPAIGFLVAAKSILRFGTVSNNRQATEYVIIGTLASFGWAIAATICTQALIGALPALEIGAATP